MAPWGWCGRVVTSYSSLLPEQSLMAGPCPRKCQERKETPRTPPSKRNISEHRHGVRIQKGPISKLLALFLFKGIQAPKRSFKTSSLQTKNSSLPKRERKKGSSSCSQSKRKPAKTSPALSHQKLKSRRARTREESRSARWPGSSVNTQPWEAAAGGSGTHGQP